MVKRARENENTLKYKECPQMTCMYTSSIEREERESDNITLTGERREICTYTLKKGVVPNFF